VLLVCSDTPIDVQTTLGIGSQSRFDVSLGISIGDTTLEYGHQDTTHFKRLSQWYRYSTRYDAKYWSLLQNIEYNQYLGVFGGLRHVSSSTKHNVSRGITLTGGHVQSINGIGGLRLSLPPDQSVVHSIEILGHKRAKITQEKHHDSIFTQAINDWHRHNGNGIVVRWNLKILF
jgi:hypothetical protein